MPDKPHRRLDDPEHIKGQPGSQGGNLDLLRERAPQRSARRRSERTSTSTPADTARPFQDQKSPQRVSLESLPGESADAYLRRMVQDQQGQGRMGQGTSSERESSGTDTPADIPSTPRLGPSTRFESPVPPTHLDLDTKKQHKARRDTSDPIDTTAIDRDVAKFADQVGMHDFARQLRESSEQ